MNESKQLVYFGSFSPMHIGHLTAIEKVIIDPFTSSYNGSPKLDIIVSPQNPYKDIDDLLPLDLRKEICEISLVEHFENFKWMFRTPKPEWLDNILDFVNFNLVEEELPLPNYTYLTLRELTKQYGEKPTIIFGTDVLNEMPTWRSYEEVAEYPMIQLLRKGEDDHFDTKLHIVKNEVVDIDVSSTVIRNLMLNYDTRNVIVEEGLMTEGAFKLLNRHYELSSL